MSSDAGESSGDASNAGNELHYEAESPDELALVQAANAYGCKLLKRTPDRVIVWLPGKTQLPFMYFEKKNDLDLIGHSSMLTAKTNVGLLA